MSSVQDIVTSLGINSAISVALVGAYAVLKNQPINSRIYYGKLIQLGQEGVTTPAAREKGIGRYINLNMRTYLHVMDWLRASLKMPEQEFINHAGLDSAVFLRMLVLGMKTFLPMMVFSFVVLVPINVTDNELQHQQMDTSQYTYGAIDTITISNVKQESPRLWAHLIAAYLYTAWTCYLLLVTYQGIVDLRFKFLADQERRPDQFTVLCRCVPEVPNKSVKQNVEDFFRINHPDHYLLNSVVYNANKLENYVNQKEILKNKIDYWETKIATRTPIDRPTRRKGFWGLWGEKVDRVEYYNDALDEINAKIRKEREEVLTKDDNVMPAAFVSFDNRWGAAVCSQTRQSKDSSQWLTEWAPEPRDVYWANLPLPYLQLNSRKLVTAALLVLLIIFFIIPVSFVQSLANLDKIEKKVHFLKPLIEWGAVKSILQGFLPGLSLKIFMAILPLVLWFMSSLEGHISYSKIERRACVIYLIFMLVNIFLGNVLAGTALEQLKLFAENPTEIPNILGKGIPQRSTFFITYIMVDGWTHCAMDLIRIFPFLIYYVRRPFLRTERDRELASPVGWIKYITELPRLGLYFLLGFVYSTISPLILPFIIIYLLAAYVVYRNQMINAYDQKYESAGRYWPVMFSYVVIGLLVMHATLIGLMTLKKAASSTPFLLPLPIATIIFWLYCKQRFYAAFRYYPLEEVRKKDTMDQEREPELDHKEFLEKAYMHPALRAVLTGDGNLSDSDADSDVAELLHIPARSPITRDNDDGSGGTGSISLKKLLDEESSRSKRKQSSGKMERSRDGKGGQKESRSGRGVRSESTTYSEEGGNDSINNEADESDSRYVSPRPSAGASPRPSAAASPRPSAAASPRPSATASPRPSAAASPRPSAAASPRPSATASPRPSATASPRPSATASPRRSAPPSSAPSGRDRNSIGHYGP